MRKLLLVLCGVVCLVGCSNPTRGSKTEAETTSVAETSVTKVEESKKKETYTITNDVLLSEIRGMANIAYSIRDAGFRWDLTTENTLDNYLYYSRQSTDSSFVDESNSGIYLVEGFNSGDFLDFLFASYRGKGSNIHLLNSEIKDSFTYYEGTDAEITLSFGLDDLDEWYCATFVNSKEDSSKWLIKKFVFGKRSDNKLHYKADETLEFDTDVEYEQIYVDYIADHPEIEVLDTFSLIDLNNDGVKEAVVPCVDGIRFLVASKDDVFVTEPYVDNYTWEGGDDEATIEAFSRWGVNGVWTSNDKVLVEMELAVTGGETNFNALNKHVGVSIPYDEEELAGVHKPSIDGLLNYELVRRVTILYNIENNGVYFFPEDIYYEKEDTLEYPDGTAVTCEVNGLIYKDLYTSPEKHIDYMSSYDEEDYEKHVGSIIHEEDALSFRTEFEKYKSTQVMGHIDNAASASISEDNISGTERLRNYISASLADVLSDSNWEGFAWKAGSDESSPVNAILYRRWQEPHDCIFVLWDGAEYQNYQVSLDDYVPSPDSNIVSPEVSLEQCGIFDDNLVFLYSYETTSGIRLESDWPMIPSHYTWDTVNGVYCALCLPLSATNLSFEPKYSYHVTFRDKDADLSLEVRVFDDSVRTNELQDGWDITYNDDRAVVKTNTDKNGNTYNYVQCGTDEELNYDICMFNQADRYELKDDEAISWKKLKKFSPYAKYNSDDWLND